MSAEAAYQKRVSSGFYDEVYQKLQDLNPFLLANLTWDTDFKHDPTYAREFIHTSDGQRFSTFIFGEIAPASDGTIHSALGNHFIGTSPKYFSYVADDTKLKDVFMLRSPSAAPDHLRLLFEYQLSTLDRLRESDAAIEDSKGMNITHVTEIIRSCDDVSQPSLIAAHIGPKYDLPRHLQNVPTPSNSNKSKPKTKRIYAERNTSANTAGTTSNSTAREIVTPSNITVGGLYDPRLLPDYGGSMFHHVHAKLVQKDITDIDGELIPMWETYDKLRTGTLVLMKGQFTMYQMEDKQRDGYKKFYQFNVHRTYVLARSEEPFEVPEKPSLPAFMKELETTNERDAADDILDSVFSLKRAKTSSDDSGRTVIPEETPGSSSTQAMPPKIIDSRKTRTSTRGKKTDPKEKGKAADDMDNVEDKIEDAMPVDNED